MVSGYIVTCVTSGSLEMELICKMTTVCLNQILINYFVGAHNSSGRGPTQWEFNFCSFPLGLTCPLYPEEKICTDV